MVFDERCDKECKECNQVFESNPEDEYCYDCLKDKLKQAEKIAKELMITRTSQAIKIEKYKKYLELINKETVSLLDTYSMDFGSK